MAGASLAAGFFESLFPSSQAPHLRLMSGWAAGAETFWAGMRITWSAPRSASRSNRSPGRPTLSFAWTSRPTARLPMLCCSGTSGGRAAVAAGLGFVVATARA